MNQQYKVGLRAAKSAIAVFLCLLIAMIFKRSELLLASIAAIICMQPTYNETYKTGLYRLVGTSIGGFLGLIVLLITKHHNATYNYRVFMVYDIANVYNSQDTNRR